MLEPDNIATPKQHDDNNASATTPPLTVPTSSTDLIGSTDIPYIKSENGGNAEESPAAAATGDSDLAADHAGQKRKYGALSKSDRMSRALSPPWKKIAAEGPTSFLRDGKRRSSRTNQLPQDMQPPSLKRRRNGRALAAEDKPNTKNLRPKSNRFPTANGHASKDSLDKTTYRRSSRSANGASNRTSSNPSASKSSHASSLSSPERSRHSTIPTSRNRSNTAASDLPEPTSPHRPTRGRRTRHSNANTNGGPDSKSPQDTNTAVSPSYTKLRLRVRDPVTARQHPSHFTRPKMHDSFEDWLKHDNRLEGDDSHQASGDKIRQEAAIRLRIAKASEPGGLLSEGHCSRLQVRGWVEPRPRYGKWSYVCAHVEHFSVLLRDEHDRHVKRAKRCADAAKVAFNTVETWAKYREAKSAEQIWQEEWANQVKRYKQLVKDMEIKWLMVRQEVDRIKLVKWEQEQEVRGNKALDEMLDQSTLLLHQHRYRDTSELLTEYSESRAESVAMENGDTITGAGDEEVSAMGEDSEDSENMSESSDAESSIGDIEDDGELTQEQLRQKYDYSLKQRSASPEDSEEDEGSESESHGLEEMLIDSASMSDGATTLDQPSTTKLGDFGESLQPEEPLANGLTNGHHDYENLELEEVDPELLDDSEDGSTDMSSDMGSLETDSEDEEDQGSNAEDDESDAGEPYSLLNLYLSKQELASEPKAISGQLAVSTTEAGQEGFTPQDSLKQNGTDAVDDDAMSIGSEVQARSGTDGIDALTPQLDGEAQVTTPTTSVIPSSNRPPRTAISPLLRGTLRGYQVDGVDWLSKLYIGDRNGILADEMGLGKTIQTIALLAHLATHHEIWGPHLVVVPTSVMLNWEMEFKKWCPAFDVITYYGTQEERKRKRQNWTTSDFNVCITSYQLILQDSQVFKRRSWHYLILDEAHNIKNFQTQRWQTMLTFRTNSRLLLTGTPLQNNLQELWSLLYFLMPAGTDGAGGFADLEGFLNSMKRPADQILDQGRQKLDAEAQARVNKLHEILRPFLLRRLKSEVEKQMPGKYEHVVYCRLSKRQRQLYNEFMGRADTKQTLSSGNYMSIIGCLMSLRKVCNHPDLFETRQIVTSLAMPRSAVANYEIKELIVRRRLLARESLDLEYCGLLPVKSESSSKRNILRSAQLHALRQLEGLVARESRRLQALNTDSGIGAQSVLAQMAAEAQKNIVWELQNRVEHVRRSTQRAPIYGRDLMELVSLRPRTEPAPPNKKRPAYSYGDWYLDGSVLIPGMMPTVEQVSERTATIVAKFSCTTPAVVAEDVRRLTLTDSGQELIHLAQKQLPGTDPFHDARIKQSIAFPDKRLLQYDCGKLQRLDILLRQLQAGGHRCLIFTQMTKVLDILEQFLNIHGHRYLRLDGSTKIDDRQAFTDRFNKDPRILAFILSSRSGGLGINLTGADTVIFYDIDWNPAMDAQCQDRCHRIGQTRDVHIYRFVSESTIEANILRKSNQKRLLDDVIIQKGEFTTDYFNRVTYQDALDGMLDTEPDPDASAAMDRILADQAGLGTVLDSVEDKEDAAAAKAAQKEMVNINVVDEKDFTESTNAENTPKTSVPPTPGAAYDEEEPGHVDDYMVKFLMEDLKDVAIRIPKPKGIRAKRKK